MDRDNPRGGSGCYPVSRGKKTDRSFRELALWELTSGRRKKNFDQADLFPLELIYLVFFNRFNN